MPAAFASFDPPRCPSSSFCVFAPDFEAAVFWVMLISSDYAVAMARLLSETLETTYCSKRGTDRPTFYRLSHAAPIDATSRLRVGVALQVRMARCHLRGK